MTSSAHTDRFVRDHLPPIEQWPDFLFSLPELDYPDRLNCVVELLDRWVATGHGERACLISHTETLTYAQLAERVNRIANVLTRDLGMVPGHRVLLRGPNNPMLIAACLAVIKAGGVAVPTMPLLRAGEISFPIAKARIALALCDLRLGEELEKSKTLAPELERIVYYSGEDRAGGLDALMRRPGYEHFSACDTASDDVCLIAFTSGTTGEPKGTMHFHRDLLATCDSYGRHVLRARADDLFSGSPPLAFTFGLGGLLLFPLRIGAATLLLEKAPPDALLAAIAEYRVGVLVTAPTSYRAMAAQAGQYDLSSLHKCVAAGEALPAATRKLWRDATGMNIIDGIGTTEMLHIFISHDEAHARPGATGKPIPGYRACVMDEEGQPLPAG